jgi:hypothetical protein
MSGPSTTCLFPPSSSDTRSRGAPCGRADLAADRGRSSERNHADAGTFGDSRAWFRVTWKDVEQAVGDPSFFQQSCEEISAGHGGLDIGLQNDRVAERQRRSDRTHREDLRQGCVGSAAASHSSPRTRSTSNAALPGTAPPSRMSQYWNSRRCCSRSFATSRSFAARSAPGSAAHADWAAVDDVDVTIGPRL